MEYLSEPSIVVTLNLEQRFIRRWIFAFFAGDFLAVLISVVLVFLWSSAHILTMKFGWTVILTWAIFGAIVGLAQWFVLKEPIHHSHWWVWTLATVAGTLVGSAMIRIYNLSSFWSLVLSGSTVGFAQFLILRKRFFYSGWWIIIYTVRDAEHNYSIYN